VARYARRSLTLRAWPHIEGLDLCRLQSDIHLVVIHIAIWEICSFVPCLTSKSA
jgi:hypothetical protein